MSNFDSQIGPPVKEEPQSSNQVFASPNGSKGFGLFRSLVGADLPSPSAGTLGGVESIAAVSHNFLTGISTSGAPSQAQPAFTDISGTASGAQLPNPTSSTLGGVQSLAGVSHKWINTISTSGVPSASQPATTDLSDVSSGTWTPVLYGATTAGSNTYSAQNGTYQVVGNLVYFSFTMVLTATSGMVGSALISGLPFPVNSSVNALSFSTFFANIVLTASSVSLWSYCTGGSSFFYLFEVNVTGGANQLPSTAIANNSQIYVSGWYQK